MNNIEKIQGLLLQLEEYTRLNDIEGMMETEQKIISMYLCKGVK